MAELIVCVVILLTVVIFLSIRQYRLKREIYSFSDRLERCIDAMLSGKTAEEPGGSEGDSLWSKTYDKLQKLYTVWTQKSQENIDEKKKIKELISDISHQTKIPVSNMKIYLELMQEEKQISEKGRGFLTRLEEQTDKLDFLLQSLVKMSRLETGVIEIHSKKRNLYETIALAVAAIVPKAEKKSIHLHVECEEEIAVCHDRKWTEEAVFNILDNAVKYTGKGGRVGISVCVQDMFTKISIKDSGKGILPQRQAQIFSRFYREPEVYDQEGIGVGLYLAREIITLQNGYIEVHSEPGQGADFQIYLPNDEFAEEE